MVIIVISLDLAIPEMTIPLPSFSVEHISSKRCKRDLDAFMQSFEVDTKPGRHQQTCYLLFGKLSSACMSSSLVFCLLSHHSPSMSYCVTEYIH